MASTVTVSIVGDAASLKRAMGDAQSSLSSFADKAQSVGDRATSIGRSMTFGITLPLIGLGKMAFDELSQSAAASAQTEAAIKSTGGAANVTAAQVDQLSSALLRKTGIDDELIKSGANVLLTFRGIRNEAGKGNDIFDQATKATLDLSVALGKDMTSSAILVGKALQDPISGASALRRVGVQLNDQQVESIKTFIAQGDVMSAQKVILKELTTEVGGSAAAYGDTFAGKIAKAKEELKNASASILSTAVPVMQKLADAALGAAHAFDSLPAPVKEATIVFAALAAAIGPLSYAFGAIAKLVSGTIAVVSAIAGSYETLALKAMYATEAIKAMTLAQVAAAAAPVLLAGGIIVAAVALDRLIGDSSRFSEFAKNARQGTDEGSRLAEVLIAGATRAQAPLDSLRGALQNLRMEQQQNTAAYDAGRISQEQALPIYSAHRSAIEGVKTKIADLKQGMAEAKAAEEARKAALHDLAVGTTDLATATDEAKQAIYDLQSAVLAASGSELGLEQANLNLTKAQQAYTEALDSGDPSKITEAELSLQQARLGVAQATLSAQDSQQKLLDIVRQGPDAVSAEIKKLKDAQAQYGDTSGAIQEQIDKLFWLSVSLNGLPNRTVPHVDVTGVDEATTKIITLREMIDTLPPVKRVAVILSDAF